MQDLHIGLLQNDPIWQAPEQNRDLIADQLRREAQGLDLVILPEMFSAGFGSDPQRFAEPANGPTFEWMSELATELQLAICGSYAVLIEDKAVNRLLWIYPDGQARHYDKRHLFRMAGEHTRYHSGNERVTIEYMGWRINLQVCYDLRFPVWCRNQNDYDLQIFVANWPEARRDPWRTLLKARAIENLAYVAGVNRTGLDGKQLSYSGDSLVFDPSGKCLMDAERDAGLYRCSLNYEALTSFRDNFPAFMDADAFTIHG